MLAGRHLEKFFARVLPGVTFVAAVGCGGPTETAFDNRTFYHFGARGDQWGDFESPYPPLDLNKAEQTGYQGVKILQGTVRISRRNDWQIRRASNEPEGRFIEYVSPRQVIVSVYERVEAPEETWRTVIDRYLEETEAQGAAVLEDPVPRVLGNAQARAFDVERKVPATKAPYRVFSREYLARGEGRVVLVQIVRPSDDMDPYNDELMRVIRTLEVL
jgi:hypothetical protein